jgi:hypothetical protein
MTPLDHLVMYSPAQDGVGASPQAFWQEAL